MEYIRPKKFPCRPSAFLIGILKLPMEARACLLFARTGFWRPDADRGTHSASKLPKAGKHATFTGRPKQRLRGKSSSYPSSHQHIPVCASTLRVQACEVYRCSQLCFPFTQGLPHIIANETSIYITPSFPICSICSVGKKKN